jgi:hypothetical protein
MPCGPASEGPSQRPQKIVTVSATASAGATVFKSNRVFFRDTHQYCANTGTSIHEEEIYQT